MYKKVLGSARQAQPVIVGKDTVYVHRNIVKYVDEFGDETNLYEYDEKQYPKNKYLELMSDRQETASLDGVEITETVVGIALDQGDLIDTLAEMSMELESLKKEILNLKNTKKEVE